MCITLQIYNVICAERPNSHKDSINTTAKRWQFKIHTLLENFAKHKCVIMPAACKKKSFQNHTDLKTDGRKIWNIPIPTRGGVTTMSSMSSDMHHLQDKLVKIIPSGGSLGQQWCGVVNHWFYLLRIYTRHPWLKPRSVVESNVCTHKSTWETSIVMIKPTSRHIFNFSCHFFPCLNYDHSSPQTTISYGNVE